MNRWLIFAMCLLNMALFPAQTLQGQGNAAANTKVFAAGDFGSAAWRIPAICMADTTLIAIADARRQHNGDLPNDIDLVARYSTDLGKTWSGPVVLADFGSLGASDPALAYHPETRTVVCLFASHRGLFQSTPDDPIRIQLSTSTDSGRSWSEPKDITHQITQPGWFAAWVASGTIHSAPDGRLFAAIGVRENASNAISNYLIFSTDGGRSWQTAPGRACENGDEAKVVTLRDGRILMLVRHKGHRLATWTADGGSSWTKPILVSDLIEPAVNGDLIRYCHPGKEASQCEGPLVFSVASHPTERKNLTVFISHDEGATWLSERVICHGPAAYSAMTVLHDGTIGILYEDGQKNQYDLLFARFYIKY